MPGLKKRPLVLLPNRRCAKGSCQCRSKPETSKQLQIELYANICIKRQTDRAWRTPNEQVLIMTKIESLTSSGKLFTQQLARMLPTFPFFWRPGNRWSLRPRIRGLFTYRPKERRHMSLCDRPFWTLGVILVGSFLLLVVVHRRLAGSRQPAGGGKTPVQNKENANLLSLRLTRKT